VYSIIEIIYRTQGAGPPNAGAKLVVDSQEFIGFPTGNGVWHFLFSPKQVKKWSYRIVSGEPVHGQTGAFTSVFRRGFRPLADYPHCGQMTPIRLREGMNKAPGLQLLARE
jgi:hypothetical protein